MHVRCLLYMLNKCYLYTTNVLYLCVMHMQLDWTSKATPVTERSPEPAAISVPVLPILHLPATMSLALFESKSSGPSGPVPTSNNGRISTASGLAVSCSLPGCERLREEGGLNAKGNRKVPGNIWGMGCVGQDTWESGVLARRRDLLFLRGEVGGCREIDFIEG